VFYSLIKHSFWPIGARTRFHLYHKYYYACFDLQLLRVASCWLAVVARKTNCLGGAHNVIHEPTYVCVHTSISPLSLYSVHRCYLNPSKFLCFLFSWKKEGNINKVGRDWIKWPSYLDLIVAWFNFTTAIVTFQLKRYIFLLWEYEV